MITIYIFRQILLLPTIEVYFEDDIIIDFRYLNIGKYYYRN
jgi:hypothetical protein